MELDRHLSKYVNRKIDIEEHLFYYTYFKICKYKKKDYYFCSNLCFSSKVSNNNPF